MRVTLSASPTARSTGADAAGSMKLATHKVEVLVCAVPSKEPGVGSERVVSTDASQSELEGVTDVTRELFWKVSFRINPRGVWTGMVTVRLATALVAEPWELVTMAKY